MSELVVIIAEGEPYFEMAGCAAELWRRHNGGEVEIVGAEDWLPHPSWAKCTLFDRFPGVDSLIFLDADIAAVGRTEWGDGDFCGVMEEPWMVRAECQAWGCDPARYFNCGLMRVHRRASGIFEEAIAILQHNRGLSVGSWMEQTAVNKALLDYGGGVVALPERFNWHVRPGRGVPQGVVNYHFCGRSDHRQTLAFMKGFLK